MGKEERWYALLIEDCGVDYLGRHPGEDNAINVAYARHKDSVGGVISETNLHKLILNAWKALEIK